MINWFPQDMSEVVSEKVELGIINLGHRSILGDPHTKNWKLKLNEIKNREAGDPTE